MGDSNYRHLHRIQTSQDLSRSLRSKASETAIAAMIKDAHKYLLDFYQHELSFSTKTCKEPLGKLVLAHSDACQAAIGSKCCLKVPL